MTSTPVAAKLVFLNELAELPAEGEKVRFLGCVHRYDVPTGILIVKHHYPHESPKPAKTMVDINVLLGSLASTDIEVGSWINVFGYMIWTSHSKISRLKVADKTGVTQPRRSLVKAVMIQSAGAINLGEYEKVLAERKSREKALDSEK